MTCVCGFVCVSNDYPANIIHFDLIFRIILGNYFLRFPLGCLRLSSLLAAILGECLNVLVRISYND